jgi:hypothetical protein
VSAAISNAISFAHALTKQLLHVPDSAAHSILIAVLPRTNGTRSSWTVRVSYADFSLVQEAETLDDAIGAVVGSLTQSVAQQLEEGQKLLAQT